MASHFSAVILVRKESGRPQVLVQRYSFRKQVQMKFPGGTNEGHPGEDPEVTALREFMEETSLLVNCAPTLVRRDVASENHTKYFFLADNAEGETRSVIKSDEGEEDLLPPEWMDVSPNLAQAMFKSHRPALLSAMDHMAQLDPDWGWAFQRLAHLF